MGAGGREQEGEGSPWRVSLGLHTPVYMHLSPRNSLEAALTATLGPECGCVGGFSVGS